MRILVTGASGRLGSCVCRLLAEANQDFMAVDKFPDERANYPVKLVDLMDWEMCAALLEGVDILVHFANHTGWDNERPQEVLNRNVTMNMNVFQAAVNAGCRRMIFASSIQVFSGQLPTGDRSLHDIVLPYLPVDSDMPAIPRNTYALSKLLSENMLRYFSTTMGLTCIAIRFPLLIDSHLLRLVKEKGRMGRCNAYDLFAYLPVYSAAELVVRALWAELEGYHQYFVASKDNLEQRAAREIIEQELSHLPRKKTIEEMDSLVDCSKVESELGWTQPRSLTESYEKYRHLEVLKPY